MRLSKTLYWTLRIMHRQKQTHGQAKWQQNAQKVKSMHWQTENTKRLAKLKLRIQKIDKYMQKHLKKFTSKNQPSCSYKLKSIRNMNNYYTNRFFWTNNFDRKQNTGNLIITADFVAKGLIKVSKWSIHSNWDNWQTTLTVKNKLAKLTWLRIHSN